jgi:hypothetical protein
MNLSSIKPNFSTANTANTLVQRDASGKVAVSLANSAITGETALTAVAGDDAILVSDTSDAAVRKVAINDLLTFMKANTTSQLAIVTFTCAVGSGDNLPASMSLAYNPFGLGVSVNSNRIQLGSGNWQIETVFSGYYQSWSGWLGGMYSDQILKSKLEIDGGNITVVLDGSGLYTTTGSAGLGGLGRDTSDSVVQVKVTTTGYVTPIRNIGNVTGGIGALGGSRCTSYVYKI